MLTKKELRQKLNSLICEDDKDLFYDLPILTSQDEDLFSGQEESVSAFVCWMENKKNSFIFFETESEEPTFKVCVEAQIFNIFTVKRNEICNVAHIEHESGKITQSIYNFLNPNFLI